ncbi:MAG: ATP-binding protein [Anaerolineales bacterium]
MTAAVNSLTKLLKPHPHRELFGALADSVEDGVLVLDGTGRSVVAANHAFLLLTGYTRRELERLTAEVLFPPETRFADSPGTRIPELAIQTHSGESLQLDIWPYPIGSPPTAILLKARASALRERSAKRARLEGDRLAHLIEISSQIADSAVAPSLTLFDLAEQVLSANYVGVYRASPHSEDYVLDGTLPKDFPQSLPPASFDLLDRPSLWLIGTRPNHPLHKAARAAGLKALRSTPLGSPTTWIGLLVAGWQEAADLPSEVTGLMEVLANLYHARILMGMHREVVADLESELDQARREFSSTFQAVQEGLISLDSNLKVIRANSAACQLLGYLEAELKGQAIQDVLVGPADIMTTMLDALGHQLTAERNQLMLHRRDGRPFPASLRAVPQEESQASRLILVLNDLSERKAIEDQTETLAQRALLGEVAAIFAHEVRNPINNISTGLQLAASRLGRNHPQHEALEIIRSECKRLDQLMDDVLFFARPLELKFTPLSLADLVDRILARWDPRLKLAKVGTHTNYVNGSARVLADERTIEQVLVNLITNSVQAMADGGTLSVHITADGSGGQLLKIADTGPGILPEQMDRIFDPFFTTKKSGTGLGLAISRRIMTAHQGSIAVESFQDAGTVFTLQFPLAPSELGG